MRIGIITFHREENYGAALQCRALYSYLKSRGHDVEVVDYQDAVTAKRNGLFPRPHKNLVKYALSFLHVLTHLKAFRGRKRRFREYFGQLSMSGRLTGEQIMADGLDYDLVIAGSDQIWNPKITRGFNEIYFLQFPGSFVRATYAASAGAAFFLRTSDEQFNVYMKKLDYISVREKELAAYIQRNVGREAVQSLDPTLLLDREQWEQMCSSVRIELPEKYILMYHAKAPGELRNIAAKLSRDSGVPVVHVSPSWDFRLKRSSFGLIKEIDAGPAEFLYLIKNAWKVATSSFHGAVFSCIFRRDLYIYIPEKDGDPRLQGVAGQFGVTDRIFYSYREFCDRQKAAEDVVYDTRIYEQLRGESFRYLDEITATQGGDREEHI